jgi:signal transduction histidine kinase
MRSGDPFEMEYPIRGADGKYRWFLTRVNPVHDRHGQVLRWFGTNTDVDQVKRAEQALREESHMLELLNSTGSALASTRDLRPLLQAATDAATGIAGARQGAFLYHGSDGRGRPAVPLYTISGASPAGIEAFGEPRAMGLFGPGQPAAAPWDCCARTTSPTTALSRTPARSACPPPTRRSAATWRCRWWPTRANCWAGCSSAIRKPHAFSERTERIVRGIAAQAAVAIDNVRLYEAAQRAAEERKVLLESERLARAEAERTSQMKDEFLSTLSHELRTPLSAILGWAQVLRRGSRDQNDLQKRPADHRTQCPRPGPADRRPARHEPHHLGQGLAGHADVAPAGFIDAAIETVRPAADAKNIRIDKHYALASGMVAGDPARLQQVVWNLLSNAIKFTPRDGRVDIELGANDSNVVITIRDNGAGIRPEFITHVFERFRQADASMTRRHGGLGLGLGDRQAIDRAAWRHRARRERRRRLRRQLHDRAAAGQAGRADAALGPRRHDPLGPADAGDDGAATSAAPPCWWSTTTAMRAN